MQRMKTTWKSLPNRPRRVLTFILGMLLVIAAGLIGALPGPGGTILFLIGIAVLATEFTWAERFRDYLLALLGRAGAYVRKHPRFSAILIVVSAGTVIVCAYVFYTKIL